MCVCFREVHLSLSDDHPKRKFLSEALEMCIRYASVVCFSSLCMCVCLCVCLSLSVSLCLSAFLSVCLSVCLSIHTFFINEL